MTYPQIKKPALYPTTFPPRLKSKGMIRNPRIKIANRIIASPAIILKNLTVKNPIARQTRIKIAYDITLIFRLKRPTTIGLLHPANQVRSGSDCCVCS